MRRTRAANNTGSIPAVVNESAPGYYVNRDGLTPGATIDADELNIIQEELVAIVALGTPSLDDTGATRDQAANAIMERFGALDSALVSISGATTADKAILAATGAYVDGDRALSAASDRGSVSGDNSAVIASKGVSPATCSIGAAASQAAIVASLDSSVANQAIAQVAVVAGRDVALAGTGSEVAAVASHGATSTTENYQSAHLATGGGCALNGSNTAVAIIASDGSAAAACETAAAVGGSGNAIDTVSNALVAASMGCTLQGGASALAVVAAQNCQVNAGAARTAVIASYDCDITEAVGEGVILGCVTSNMPTGSPLVGGVMLASQNCDASTGSASPNYSVFGGASGSSTPRKWALESSTGTVRGTVAFTTSGLDYAEMFPNADGVAHPPGAFLSRAGRSARLGPGRFLGIVSVNPTVVGGDDGLAWAGAYQRDEWGALVMGDDGSPLVREGYDPHRPQVSRRDRPDEWTCVGLLGQLLARVADGVAVDDYVEPGEAGVGVRSETVTRCEVMEIASPYDAARGYAIALVLVR